MKRLVLCTLAALMSTSAAALEFIDGHYSYNAECQIDGKWPDTAHWLTLTGNKITWSDGSACELVNPVNIRGMSTAKLYDANCNDPVDKWTQRVFVGHDQNSISTSFGDTATRWVYCGPVER